MEKTITVDISKQPKSYLCTSCLICGESVPLTEREELQIRHGMNIHSKICDKCREAILYMRKQMEVRGN